MEMIAMRNQTLIVLSFLLTAVTGATAFYPATVRAEDLDPIHFSLAHPVNQHLENKHESEHRPVPVRQYWLSAFDIQSGLEGFVLFPDGKSQKATVKQVQSSWQVSFKTPRGDGPQHGIHSVYAVDKQVRDNVLYVRTAKWLTIHHSCGWGHGHKYSEERQTPAHLDAVPFEIVPPRLWDRNFHVRTKSGDQWLLKVLLNGKPVDNARVKVTTLEGWSKEMRTREDGTAQVQLIRDYYPKDWERFKRRRQNKLIVTAEYHINVQGEHEGKPYDRIQYSATLPWKYTPAEEDYSSYSSGLAVGGLSFLVTLIGVLFYRERRKKPLREVFFNEKN